MGAVRRLSRAGRAKFDFGDSAYSRRPVALDISQRLPATLELSITALVLAIVLGIPLGTVAAVYHNRWPDTLLRILTVGGVAIAAFWFAIELQLVFAMELDWLPLRGRLSTDLVAPPTITGFYLIDSLLAGRLDAFCRRRLAPRAAGRHALARRPRHHRAVHPRRRAGDAAEGFRRLRARAGFPARAMIWKFVLKNSVVAAITQIGLLFGGLIAGAVVVETIFDWPGIGFYTVQAILTADYKVMLAVTLLIGVIYAAVNILVDLVHGLIDPRLTRAALIMLIFRKFAKDKPAVIGLIVVLAVVVMAIFAPLLAPYPQDVSVSHLLLRLKPPERGASVRHRQSRPRHPFSRVILGSRGALEIAVMVVGLSMLIGVPLGLIGGYYQNFGAEAIMRVTDMFLAVPQLILALAFAQLMTPSLTSAMLALTLTYWPFFARIVYAETRRLKSSLFIDALRCIGAGGPRILFLHILPNCISPIIVRATIGMGFTILVAAVLGFLGMGATPPDPDWGLAISESRQYLPDAWWFSTFPGLAIFLTVLGFNLLGDGLRDIVDPRLRRSR